MTVEAPEVTTPVVDTARPWPGLDAFTEALSPFFFGRDAEADELFRRVRRDLVTLLFGQSGLGKTSLLQAGLFPRLRWAGFLPILIRLDHSAGAPSPAAQVKAAIEREFAAAELSGASPIGAEESLWGYFHRADRRLADYVGKEIVPVLVFDQFEEIFTQGLAAEGSRAASQSFLGELAELIENRPPEALEQAIEADPDLVENFLFDRQDYRVVLALREDFLAALESLRSRAPSLGRNRYRLRRMSGRQGLDAILNPAPGLVAPEVAQEIIRFVGRANPEYAFGAPGAGETAEGFEVEPSLLSLVCRELNERRLSQGLHEISADLLAGSRDDIIERFYERCFAGQPAPLRAFVEDKLLSANGFRESVARDTAHRALHESGVPVAALDELVRRRLLRIEERFDVARVEIIHDVLTTVICKSRDTRRLRQAEKSAAEREAELRRERRRARRARWVAATMAMLALFTIGLAWLAWRSSNEANRSRHVAEDRTEEVARVQLLAAGAMLESVEIGRVPVHAIRALREYQKKLEKLATEIPNEVDRQRELAVIAFTIGTFLEFQGKDDPLNEFQNYAQIMGQLASRIPADLSISRDLAASYTVLGEVLKRRNHRDTEQRNQDLSRALAEFRASSKILAGLAAKEPENLIRSRELAVSYNRIASVLKEQGDSSAALQEWRRSESTMLPLLGGEKEWLSELAQMRFQTADTLQELGNLHAAVDEWRAEQGLLRELLKDDPSNSEHNAELANVHILIGNIFASQHQFASAMAEYRAALHTYQRLAETDQENLAKWQQKIVASHELLGDLLRDQSDPAVALAEYRAALVIRQSLAEKNPSYVQLQRELSVGHAQVGDLLRERGELPAALAEYRVALDIQRRLAERGPDYSTWQRDLSVKDPRGGDENDLTAAVAEYRVALDIIKSLAQMDQDNPESQHDLLLVYERFGSLGLSRKDFLSALDAFKKAESLALRLKELKPTAPESTRDLIWVQTQLKNTYRSTTQSQAPADRQRNGTQGTPPTVR